MHWADRHGKDADDCEQAVDGNVEGVPARVYHVLGEDERQSDAGLDRRETRQKVRCGRRLNVDKPMLCRITELAMYEFCWMTIVTVAGIELYTGGCTHCSWY